jgi:hypothetical protein
MRATTTERLRLARCLRSRAERRPLLAVRLDEAGFAYSFLSDEQQNALSEFRLGEGARRRWLDDFSTASAAIDGIEVFKAQLPPLLIVLPGDDDEQPALMARLEAVLQALRLDITLFSPNGCLLVAPDGSVGCEFFPNHAHGGDVVSVQLFGALGDSTAPPGTTPI